MPYCAAPKDLPFSISFEKKASAEAELVFRPETTGDVPGVAPHLKFTLLANCCLIQNDTTKETVGRWHQHHPVFFSGRLAVTFVRNQIRSPQNLFV